MLPSGCLTNSFETLLNGFIFRDDPFLKPTTLAIALSSGIPPETATGASSSFWELGNVGSYARQSVNPGSATWGRTDAIGGQVYNLNAITFPQATAEWGWVSGILLTDSSTYSTGSGFMYGQLATPKFIASSDQLIIGISGALFSFD